MISSKCPFSPNTRFVQPCTDTLHCLLMAKNPSIEDILNDETCIRSFRSGNIELIEFLLKNASSILEIALRRDNGNNSQVSLRAFNLFSSENRGLINVLLQTDALQQFAEQVFSDSNPSLLTLSRFSAIVTTCFAIFPGKAIEKCRFLELFFPYTSSQPVLNLFAQIVMMNDSDGKIIRFISEINLVNHLLEHINGLPNNLDDNNNNYLNNNNQEIAIGFFRLVRVFSSRREISHYFKKVENLAVIARRFNNPSINVLNAQWSTFLVLIDESTFAALRELIPSAISYIASAPTSFFYRYHIFCVDFLEKMMNMSNSENFINSYAKSFGVCNLMKKVLMKFPNHSNAHMHIVKLLRTMLLKPQLTKYVIDEIIPFASDQIIQRNNIILSASCWNLVKIFRASAKSAEVMKAVPEQAMQRISELDSLASQDYGGDVPKVEMVEVGNGPQLSPEQLLMLFREITMRK